MHGLIKPALRIQATRIIVAPRKAGTCPSKRACFVAGTLILLASGASVPIEQVRAGDMVITTDTSTGINSAQPVTALIQHENKSTLNINLDNGATITATGNHPFWVPGQGWTPAEQLQTGTPLQQPDGNTITVRNTTTGPITTVYNLTITTHHNYYYVGDASASYALMHNSGPGTDDNCGVPKLDSRPRWGHTWSQHGSGAKNTRRLKDRARSTQTSQGQWLDNERASEILHKLDQGKPGEARIIEIPSGLGQTILPSGEIVAVRFARVIFKKGGIRTTFPVDG